MICHMPAKEHASDELEAEAPLTAPPETVEAAAPIQSEGEVPTVEQGGATPATATASQLAFENAKADSTAIDHGVHQPDEYRHMCEAVGKPEKWKNYYRGGYTKASSWSASKKGGMKFDLKKGHSASAGIKEWFKGPTVADFESISVAEQLDQLRDELGDHRFDELFGSATSSQDKAIPAGQRLHITTSMYTTPFIDQMKAIAREYDDKINKPEASTPKAVKEPTEAKQPRPGKDAHAKHDTQHGQDQEVKRDLGFAREDLQRA
jgi:hypothetical protein